MRTGRSLVLGLAAPLFFLASAIPVYGAPAGFDAHDRADAICVVVVSATLGAASLNRLTAEEREGLSSVLMYFVGKLKGRHPALAMTELLAPNYVMSLQSEIATSAERCAQEATDISADLQDAAQILIDLDKPPLESS